MSLNTRIIYVGGFGHAIGRGLPGSVGVEVGYVDTSEASRDGTQADNVYRIEGLHGAGGDRRAIVQKVLPHIKPILEKFTPGVFTIVVFSLSGGSGSTVGPLLLRELLLRGVTACAIGLGDYSTATWLKNSIDSMKSLDGISSNVGKTVALAYHENVPGVPLDVINDEVRFQLQSLIGLTNQNNQELDVADIHNWINYNNICAVRPQLTILSVSDNRQAAQKVPEPISALSLYPSRDKYVPLPGTHAFKAGYPRAQDPTQSPELHFVLNSITVQEIMAGLNEQQIKQSQNFDTRRNRQHLVNINDDNVTDEGLIFS